jgi:hypothetical protein
MIRALVRFVMGCKVCSTHRGSHLPFCYEYRRWKPNRHLR